MLSTNVIGPKKRNVISHNVSFTDLASKKHFQILPDTAIGFGSLLPFSLEVLPFSLEVLPFGLEVLPFRLEILPFV